MRLARGPTSRRFLGPAQDPPTTRQNSRSCKKKHSLPNLAHNSSTIQWRLDGFKEECCKPTNFPFKWDYGPVESVSKPLNVRQKVQISAVNKIQSQ